MATPNPSNDPSLKRDSQWVRQSFMLSAKDIRAADTRWRLMTLAQQKFTDTRLGGNFSINNLPQYTRSADIKVKGLNARNNSAAATYQGMGRFYSEQIDDNSQIINVTFGLPEYNGMITFFTGFFSQDAALLANEGRGSLSYYLGRAAGFVVTVGTLMAHPWLLLGFAAELFMREPTSKYYYFKETMALYWNRVNMIANHIAVNMGIVPRMFLDDKGAAVENQPLDRNSDYVKYANRMAPDIFREGGGVDVYAVANRAQRLADARYSYLANMLKGNEKSGESHQQIVSKFEEFLTKPVVDPYPGANLDEYLRAYHAIMLGDTTNKKQDATTNRLTQDLSTVQAEQPPGEEKPAGDTQPNYGPAGIRDRYVPNDVKDGNEKTQEGYGKKPSILEYYMANRRDGASFISFRTDFGGSVSESFQNSVTESEISQKFNGMSRMGKTASFSFSGGDTGFTMIDSIKDSIKEFVAGGLESIQMSGLMALAGQAFVDIPKHWESSSAQFPTMSYTIELRSWSGNKLARYLNMYVPLSCILAGVLPISTGRQSYAAPFICQLYSRGRCVSRLAMITSVNITRGAGNMGWSRNNDCLGIDVSLEFTDLSSLMHAPIDAGNPVLVNGAKIAGGALGAAGGAAVGSAFGPVGAVAGATSGAGAGAFIAEGIAKAGNGIFDSDNPFSDYMAVLANLSTADMIYPFRQLALNMTRARESFETHFTKAHFASAFDEYGPTRVVGHAIGWFTRASERLQSN